MSDPPRPTILDPTYEMVPRMLESMDHWVCWRQKLYENKDGSKRWTKVPVDANDGGFGSSTNSDTWTDFSTAVHYSQRPRTEACGVGFVVSEDDAIVGVDIDDCRDPETGQLDSIVDSILSMADSYAEVSPTGTGVRLFLLGDPELDGNQVDLPEDAHLEVYQWGRYLTVTGHHIGESPRELRWDEAGLELYEGMVSGVPLDELVE